MSGGIERILVFMGGGSYDVSFFSPPLARHVFPWIDVNVRFGFVKYASEEEDPSAS